MDPRESGHKGGFRETLEIMSLRYAPVEIIFWSENGARSVVRARIMKVFEREGEALIRTDTGLEIRLPSILEVNGISPGDTC